jgi:4-amino-4-deoxy-L-arabinose transferase-like glycosyltransferase
MSRIALKREPPSEAKGREAPRRGRLGSALRAVPKIAWACAALAFVNGVCWAVIIPPYWVPDEVASMGYVQYVAENGDVPRYGRTSELSAEQSLAYGELPFAVEGRPSWLDSDERDLFDKLETDPDRTRAGQSAYLSNYPPGYYALAAIPYRIAYEANFLDRLFAVRLLSPFLAALTVVFVVLFLRELMPRTPWAWTVGGLAVAFQPMFGFMSGGVNNDNLLYAAAAALLFLVARAFRRGLDLRLGLAIGLTAAVGLLTKQSMLGLLPGAALGLVLIAWRAQGDARREAIKGAVAAGALGLVPWFVWLTVSNLVLDRATSDTGGLTSSSVNEAASISGQLSYLWQALLPKLPFMTDLIPWYVPYEIYFQGFIGRFGWAQYTFPLNVHRAALALFAVLAVLAGRELWRRRDVLRSRWAEPLVYATMFAGLLLLIEVAAYRYHITFFGQFFEQGRYLLPLLGLYGAFIALAVRGAGRKWGPALGAFLIVLSMGHSLFAMLLTISRFYG